MDGTFPTFQCREIWGGNKKVEQDVYLGNLKGFLLSLPYRSSHGGDLHFLSFCEREALFKIVIADVAGHGDIVSRVAMKIRDLLREYIDETDNTRLLESINFTLQGTLRDGKFVTMVTATYQANTKSLIYAYAGHPSLLHYNAAEGEWRLLDRAADAGMPLGIVGKTDYVQAQTILSPNDMLLFYTDGLLNVQRNSDTQSSVNELLSLCQRLSSSHPNPRELVNRLVSSVQESSSTGFSDDVTLLVLEVTP